MIKSNADKLIVKAVKAGYTADTFGNIYNPKGTKLKLSKTNTGYLGFMPSVVPRHLRRVILAHRFIVYFFYKEELFNWPLVRHLNDIKTDNSLDNLAVGTKSDNRKDIPFQKLSEIAKTNAHRLVAFSRKLSDKDIQNMRQLREEAKIPYYKIALLFNVSTMTAYRAIKKQAWRYV